MNDATPTQRILLDCFSRVSEVVHDTLDGIDDTDLVGRVTTTSNSIAWLVWHLSRVQDDHIAGLAGHPQVWAADGWEQRFGFALPPDATGYGHRSDDVAAVRATASQLLGYFDAVHASTRAYLGSIADADLQVVIDRSFDPPVTVEVRLVSVISDCLQHAGQAAFARGALDAGWDNADG